MCNAKQKHRFSAMALALLVSAPLLPAAALAAPGPGQKNLATATSRPYNGTKTVEVTDMYFALAEDVDYEDFSATATGTLASANAGRYTVLKGMTNIAFKNRDPESDIDWNDWYVCPERMTNIETDVTITEAVPQLSLSVDVQSGKAGQEVTVTATLVNDFDAPEGLPTAEQISLTAQNATLKEGSSVTQNGNAYSAVFVLGKEDAVFSANVLDSAVNYSPLAQPATVSVDVLKLADYSKLEAAVAKAKALNPEDYKDFSAVQSALNAIVYDLDETQQDKVDAMTAALENAIAGLEKIADAAPADGNTDAQQTDSPQTGDASASGLWFTLLLVSAAGGLGLATLRLKKSSSK